MSPSQLACARAIFHVEETLLKRPMTEMEKSLFETGFLDGAQYMFEEISKEPSHDAG